MATTAGAKTPLLSDDYDAKQNEIHGNGVATDVLEREILNCREVIDDFIAETNNIESIFQDARNRINDAFKDIDSVFNKHKRQVKKFRENKAVIKDLKEVYASDPLSLAALGEMERDLDVNRGTVDQIGLAKRKTGSVFLRLMMGRVSLRVWNESDRLQFKKEYNRFKEIVTVIFFVFPILHILFGFSLLIHQVQCLATGYAYVSLGIRENVLKLNGSKIQNWWIYHHYLSLASAILMLLVSPEHPILVYGGIKKMYFFILWQGIVMTLQIQYQRGRHYVQKALSKKTKQDIRTTEVISERPQNWYRILIPCLYITYLWEYLLGFTFLYVIAVAEVSSNAERVQMWLLAVLWFVIPTGNVLTLLRVLYRKQQLQKNLPFGLGKYVVMVLAMAYPERKEKR